MENFSKYSGKTWQNIAKNFWIKRGNSWYYFVECLYIFIDAATYVLDDAVQACI